MKEFEEIDDTEELLPRRFWWQWLSALLVVPAGVLVWAIGICEIVFHSLHPVWYCLFWTGFAGALAVLVTALPRGYGRRVRIAGVIAGWAEGTPPVMKLAVSSREKEVSSPSEERKRRLRPTSVSTPLRVRTPER